MIGCISHRWAMLRTGFALSFDKKRLQTTIITGSCWPQGYFQIDHQSQTSPSTRRPNLFLMLRRHGAELLSLCWLYLVYVGAPRADSCHAGENGRTVKSAGARAVNQHQGAKNVAVAAPWGSKVDVFAMLGHVALTAASLCRGDLTEPSLGSGATQTHGVAKISNLDKVQESSV